MNIRKYTGFLLLVGASVAALLFQRCTYDESEGCSPKESTLLHLNLKIPRLYHSSLEMSDLQETRIDYTRVQALVFEETATDEVFRYAAQIVGHSENQLTLKVPPSRSGEKYRLVIVANVEARDIPVGTSKENALNAFTFELKGKWNTLSPNPDCFPMWGEYGQTFVMGSNRDLSILLHRALARVDVGNRFEFNTPQGSDDDTETVLGLDNFKIKEVLVYRTKNLAYTATSAGRIVSDEVIAPNIPAAARFNTGSGVGAASVTDADADPLTFRLEEGGDSLLRQIYIPESLEVGDRTTRDEVPCLVIGGYYGAGNTDRVTYYRADFATYENGAPVKFKSILRNHRYVFNIQSISGPGFGTPEQALHSTPVNMSLEVVEWNEIPLEHYVQGRYFFKIENRNVTLDARAESGTGFASKTIAYETNLNPNADRKPFAYRWKSTGSTNGDFFDVSFDYAAGTVAFTAKQDNVRAGATPLSDVLILGLENFELSIRVNQSAFVTTYFMDCATVKVFGIYREGVPLNSGNYITLQVYSQSRLDGEPYDIRTVEKNGIYFQAQGAFDAPSSGDGRAYVYDIRLEGTGTPVNESGGNILLPFHVTIVSNSTVETTCSARITVGFRSKRILTIGANATYRFGYMLEDNSASRSFVDAAVNFGTTPASTVTMETNQQGYAFTIQVITNRQGMSNEVINYDQLVDALNTFQPDIILTGQAINFLPTGENSSRRTIKLLASFVKQGGVFLMFNEYYPNASSIRAMVSEVLEADNITGKNNALVYPNLVFTLPEGSGYANDPVLNGPFGDMRGKTWGVDGYPLYSLGNLPENQLTIYSRIGDEVCMFRHNTKPFLFIGDGGFISNNKNYIGGDNSSIDYFPFAIDEQHRPIPRTGFSGGKTVYNSQIFGNIMRWAVEMSDTSGIQYPETGDMFPVPTP